MFNSSTKFKINTKINTYPVGTSRYNTMLDCLDSMDVNNQVTIEQLIEDHGMKLSYYETHLKLLLNDSIVSII